MKAQEHDPAGFFRMQFAQTVRDTKAYTTDSGVSAPARSRAARCLNAKRAALLAQLPDPPSARDAIRAERLAHLLWQFEQHDRHVVTAEQLDVEIRKTETLFGLLSQLGADAPRAAA